MGDDRARQTMPQPLRIMKLMASGDAFCAGMTRSPSFSRCSSSTSTTMRPAVISASASSIVQKSCEFGMLFSLLIDLRDAFVVENHRDAARRQVDSHAVLEGDRRRVVDLIAQSGVQLDSERPVGLELHECL